MSIDENSKFEIVSLIKSNSGNLENLACKEPMILLLQLCKPFSSNEEMVNFKMRPWDIPQGFWPNCLNQSVPLRSIGGVKKGKLVFDFSNGAQSWNHWKQNGWMNENNEYKKHHLISDVEAHITKKLFSIGDKKLFSFPDEMTACEMFLIGYCNLVKGLVDWELKEWKVLGPKLETLLESSDFVMKKLYSGVSLSPYHVSITATGKEEKAENVKFLMEETENHKKNYKKELKAYEDFKEHQSTLKAIQKWFEEIFEFLKKHGKLS